MQRDDLGRSDIGMTRSTCGPILIALFVAQVYVVGSVLGQSSVKYYVSRDTGDNSRNGLRPETAFRDAGPLQGRRLGPGDEVLFEAGSIHRGVVELTAAGSLDSPVVVGRYGSGANPVLDGRGERSTMVLSNPDHVVIRDLEVVNRAEILSPRNGIEIRAEGGHVAKGIALVGLHVHHVSGLDDRNGGCGILATVGETTGTDFSLFDGFRIEDCLFHDLPFNGILLSGWHTRGRDAAGHLLAPSRNVVIRNNLLHDIAGDAICIIHTEGALIEHNEVYRSSLGQVRGNPEAASVAIWPHTSDNTVMRFNRVEGLRGRKDGQAFDVDFDCRNTRIENNFTRDNGTGFLLVCSGTDQGRPLTTQGVWVRNNLCLNECAEPPGALITVVSRVRDVVLENNAFVFSNPGRRRFIRAADWLDPVWPEGVTLRRNIILTRGELYNEYRKAVGVSFEGNLVGGAFDIGSERNQTTANVGPLIEEMTDSFLAVARKNKELKAINFEAFDPGEAGLTKSSRLRNRAREVRTR